LNTRFERKQAASIESSCRASIPQEADNKGFQMGNASVLVIGAGIAGIRSAIDIAEKGYGVHLVDNSPYIGGILAQLDYQFPNNHCGMCKMLPLVGREDASQFCMRKGLFHDNIQIMPFTEVQEVAGEPGAFEIALREKTRLVDIQRCVGCGKCEEVCPVEVEDAFNEGLTTRKAVYRPVPHNLPDMYVVDQEHCTKCGQCMIQCPTQAIDLFLVGTRKTVEVGAVVLAGGTGFFDPQPLRDRYGCGDHPDVITSLQFERLISGVGPTGGKLLRPSDGRPARRIAWLQCVGSRDLHLQRDYCSSICCMFALKEAVLAKDRGRDAIDAAIFYMDMRTFGKGFYRYQREARDEKGVRLIRSRVHTVSPSADGTLAIRYVGEEGDLQEEEFDLVVMSTGQRTQSGLKDLAGKFGIELNEWGFAANAGFSQVQTTNPGVFVCGSMTGLKDISETLVQGGAAAVEVEIFLRSKGLTGKRDEKGSAYEERDLSREPARVSMILCTCMGTMDEGVDRQQLKDRYLADPAVDRILENSALCSDEGLEEAAAALQATDTNRLLIGACLPYVYKKKLRNLGTRLGLNPALVEVVDLRSLTSAGNGNGAENTRQAQILLGTALERLKRRNALHAESVPVTHRALVVGGGIAGMTAARAISQAGCPVTLVERSETLGGRLQKIHHTLDGSDPHRLLADTVKQVEEDPGIEVLTQSRVVRSRGSVGNFHTVVEDHEGREITIAHGAAVIATGADPAPPTEYHYGDSERIVTQEEFEESLAQPDLPKERLKEVVMIQCVGSRDDQRPYCSRVCCAAALKNAFKALERNEEARITILYRDLMSYGFMEQYYTKARAQGIRFIPYKPERKPEVVLEAETPIVRFVDSILGRPVQVKVDMLVLSNGMVPAAADDLAQAFALDRGEDGFFQEAESKWRPVDFVREGLFLCGTAHSPRSINESVAQAQSAAQRALDLLSRETLRSARVVADVKASLCTLCETCVALCPYEARALDLEENRIVVDKAACQGCGACAVACPSGAAFVRGLEDKQTLSVIEATLEDAFSFL
jgi:heterodisulfide reductase subunit A